MGVFIATYQQSPFPYSVKTQEQSWLYLPFFHDLRDEAKPIVAKITQMGAKHELMAGPLTDFMIAGDVTLDQLTGNAT